MLVRSLSAALLAAAALVPLAAAETRVFVIANAPDAYGVDYCLATGASCGSLVANSYCQSQDYAQAASFRKLAADEITQGVPRAAEAAARSREDFIAIECTR